MEASGDGDAQEVDSVQGGNAAEKKLPDQNEGNENEKKDGEDQRETDEKEEGGDQPADQESSEHDRKVLALQASPSLSALFRDDTYGEVAKLMTPQEFEDGAYIIRQNEVGTGLIVVDEGKVDITMKRVVDGKTYDIDDLIVTLKEGSVVGEASLFEAEGTKTNANVIANGVVKCWVLERERFLALVGDSGKEDIERIINIRAFERSETFIQQLLSDPDVSESLTAFNNEQEGDEKMVLPFWESIQEYRAKTYGRTQKAETLLENMMSSAGA